MKISELSNEKLGELVIDKFEAVDLAEQIARNEFLILKSGYFEEETDNKKIDANKKAVKVVFDKYKDDKGPEIIEALKRLKELFDEAGTKKVKKEYLSYPEILLK
jgi:hypothetical protein